MLFKKFYKDTYCQDYIFGNFKDIWPQYKVSVRFY